MRNEEFGKRLTQRHEGHGGHGEIRNEKLGIKNE